MSFIKLITITFAILLASPFELRAKEKKGTESGGGGDASEERVNQIRSDLLNWLDTEGPKNLLFPYGLTYKMYVTKMKKILAPQKVIIAFIEKDDDINRDLKVSVHGIPKTCRGFVSELNSTPYIICNISRFANTKDSEQYRLIHHEYAGLALIENNVGAASDYRISSQITDFLSKQTELKLAVTKQLPETCKVLWSDLEKATTKTVYFMNKKINHMTGAVEQVANYEYSSVTIIEHNGEKGINILDKSNLLFASNFKNSAMLMSPTHNIQVTCE